MEVVNKEVRPLFSGCLRVPVCISLQCPRVTWPPLGLATRDTEERSTGTWCLHCQGRKLLSTSRQGAALRGLEPGLEPRWWLQALC